ncbi:MAG: ABC transporter [Actinobacteria bacterium HGW-Actinobacteria-10]|nr:MAG: ABC transporter [Actinobacteria bacterium HGW-Actinobacteria-10]
MVTRGPAGPEIGKHLSRYRHIATVLAEEGLFATIDAVGLRRVAPPRARLHGTDHQTPEQHVRHALERLGPTFIKVGQAISTRTDVIPPGLAVELAKLQDEVPPESFEHVRGVVEAELEGSIEELFLSFDPEPAAAASIGQVHWATLPDGTRVAVKVQRPDVRRQVEIDLDIGLTQARWVADHTELFGRMDVVSFAEEFADAIRGELDYTREASNAERLWRAFRDDETVGFPQVYWDYTTSRVLTLDRIDGVRLNRPEELDAAGMNRSRLAERGINCYLKQMFELGFFHADAHPGNFIAMPDGRIGFTDFGRVGRITEASRDRFIDLVWAAVNKDPELAADTLIAVSDNPGADETGLRREVRRLIGKYHGRELARIEFGELFGETLGLIRNYQLGVPSDFALLLGTLVVLEGVGQALDPNFDFATVAKPFADRVVADRLRPEVVAERVGRSWRHTVRVLEQVPDLVERMLRRASSGEIKVSVRPTGFEAIIADLHELVNRLAFALIVAALVIGFSSLLSSTGAPGWVQRVGEIGLVAAFAVSFWFFGSIILSHYRERKKH